MEYNTANVVLRPMLTTLAHKSKMTSSSTAITTSTTATSPYSTDMYRHLIPVPVDRAPASGWLSTNKGKRYTTLTNKGLWQTMTLALETHIRARKYTLDLRTMAGFTCSNILYILTHQGKYTYMQSTSSFKIILLFLINI